MTHSFTPDRFETSGLIHAYTKRFSDLPVFRKEEECIVNSMRSNGSYDYMGVVFPEKYTYGSRITIDCSFEDFGAPMVLLSMENETDMHGVLWTLEYYEFVIWKNGLNVWRHTMKNEVPSWYLALGAKFDLKCEERHVLSVETGERHFDIDIDGRKFTLFAGDITDSFSLGYTACEGICRLYGMTAEQN